MVAGWREVKIIACIGSSGHLHVCVASIRGFRRVHRRAPVVQDAVTLGRIRGFIIAIPQGQLAAIVLIYGSPHNVAARLGRVCAAQVLGHPALVADLHNGISVSVVVRHRGDFAGTVDGLQAVVCAAMAVAHVLASYLCSVGGVNGAGFHRAVGHRGSDGYRHRSAEAAACSVGGGDGDLVVSIAESSIVVGGGEAYGSAGLSVTPVDAVGRAAH